MILITGATGTIGSSLVRQLVDKGADVRAMTRDPSRAPVPRGVELVRGDFDDPESLRRAVDGIEALFLLVTAGRSVPRHDLAMLEAADAVGVSKVVKLSAIGTGDAVDEDDPRSWHVAGERAVAGGERAWTILRPASFASNTLPWADRIRAGEPIPNMTGWGAGGVVDPRDVAQLAAEALTSAKHDGQSYTLTGPEALSVPDQVDVLKEVLGVSLTTVDVPLDQAREQMLAYGMDSAMVDGAIRGYEQLAAGVAPAITDDLDRALGRPATSFREWVGDHRELFV